MPVTSELGVEPIRDYFMVNAFQAKSLLISNQDLRKQIRSGHHFLLPRITLESLSPSLPYFGTFIITLGNSTAKTARKKKAVGLLTPIFKFKAIGAFVCQEKQACKLLGPLLLLPSYNRLPKPPAVPSAFM